MLYVEVLPLTDDGTSKRVCRITIGRFNTKHTLQLSSAEMTINRFILLYSALKVQNTPLMLKTVTPLLGPYVKLINSQMIK